MKNNDPHRDAAIATGNRFYTTDRPCRRGHLTKRYTSTGNCVDCMTITTEARRKEINTIRIAKMANDDRAINLTIPTKHHALFEQLMDIALADNPVVIQSLRAIADSVCPVPSAHVKYLVGLTKTDLMITYGLKLDDVGRMIGHEQHPMKEAAEGKMPYLELGGQWYNAHRAWEVLKDQTARVMPGSWEEQT